METANELKQSGGGQRPGLPSQNFSSASASDRFNKEKPSEFLILVQHYFYYLIFLQLLIILSLSYWFLLRPKIAQVYENEAETALSYQQTDEKIERYEYLIEKYRDIKNKYGEISDEEIAKINIFIFNIAIFFNQILIP